MPPAVLFPSNSVGVNIQTTWFHDKGLVEYITFHGILATISTYHPQTSAAVRSLTRNRTMPAARKVHSDTSQFSMTTANRNFAPAGEWDVESVRDAVNQAFEYINANP